MAKRLIEQMVRLTGPPAGLGDLLPLRTHQYLTRSLIQAHLAITAAEWGSFAIVCSVLAGLVATLAVQAHTHTVTHSVMAGVLALGLALAALLHYPDHLAIRRAQQAERELPFALRALAVELGARTPFERALEHIACGPGELAQELKRALVQVQAGRPLPQALLVLADRLRSRALQRAVVQLNQTYHTGSATEGLRKLAEELSTLQHAEVLRYQARLGFSGLLFIALACVVPALFAAYLMVGAGFMELTVTPGEVYLAYLLVFPLINLLVLTYLHYTRPAVLNS